MVAVRGPDNLRGGVSDSSHLRAAVGVDNEDGEEEGVACAGAEEAAAEGRAKLPPEEDGTDSCAVGKAHRVI